MPVSASVQHQITNVCFFLQRMCNLLIFLTPAADMHDICIWSAIPKAAAGIAHCSAPSAWLAALLQLSLHVNCTIAVLDARIRRSCLRKIRLTYGPRRSINLVLCYLISRTHETSSRAWNLALDIAPAIEFIKASRYPTFLVKAKSTLSRCFPAMFLCANPRNPLDCQPQQYS